ncbi:electron transfer flavoprotein subunit alpha/FixB family protein [Paenibacillus aurantius]|uniref:Electron transfer flavoprotein subunit alpha/FixB family protein n=1 Tax=Paenibacillus aurantius TaxID=2918900 RepID=A0AA96RH69_9BACL|nr:electron transfer flavoprotein subunit alpha/FixB family protein [Paenibacillus aurantius]WNQ13048.1 electron transfer flavoprotein subunit alpha/FixB family protein [Paenibacillus aurantius]
MSRMLVVVAELRGGKLRQVSYEALQAAKTVQEDGDRITAVLIGSGLESEAQELASYGADEIQVVDHADLASYNPETYAAALLPILKAVQPHAIFFGHTALGRDLAPVTAARLQAGQISDVVAIHRSDAGPVFNRPLYAGKAFEEKRFTGGPMIVTVRPNNLPPAEPSGTTAGIIRTAYSPPSSLRTVIREVVRQMTGQVDLTEAKIIVSGGRGVKSREGFQPLEQLAAVLGAAVGASRGACDAGYCEYARQIGQTGKVVTPEIYIACGISGAIQHLAGMSQSRIIVAINKDAEAPIFQVADYGIVGDLFEVVPLLTEEFRKALA